LKTPGVIVIVVVTGRSVVLMTVNGIVAWKYGMTQKIYRVSPVGPPEGSLIYAGSADHEYLICLPNRAPMVPEVIV
jgi:hypothetical protein